MWVQKQVYWQVELQIIKPQINHSFSSECLHFHKNVSNYWGAGKEGKEWATLPLRLYSSLLLRLSNAQSSRSPVCVAHSESRYTFEGFHLRTTN